MLSPIVDKLQSLCFVRFDHVAKCLDQVSVSGYTVILGGQTFQKSSVRLGNGCYSGTGSQSRSVGRGGQDSGDGGRKFRCVFVWLLSSLFVFYLFLIFFAFLIFYFFFWASSFFFSGQSLPGTLQNPLLFFSGQK